MAEDLLERLKRRVDEQRRVFGFLASSLDEEGRLDGLMRRCDGQRRVLSPWLLAVSLVEAPF